MNDIVVAQVSAASCQASRPLRLSGPASVSMRHTGALGVGLLENRCAAVREGGGVENELARANE